MLISKPEIGERLEMKHFVSISLLVVIVTLVGCQSNTVTIPKAKMFSINVDAPKNLQADELFVVNGTLVNTSKSSWLIEHGADMFTYDIYDLHGELVLQDVTRSVDLIGFVMTLKPNETYSFNGEEHVQPKHNELTLPAGSYEIVSKAKFRIKHESKDFDFEIESLPLEIKVY